MIYTQFLFVYAVCNKWQNLKQMSELGFVLN